VGIRLAKRSDKGKVLAFCKDTFSWGDYISQVWDNWASNGTLLVYTDFDRPVGLCHLFISEIDKLGWIEGIRVSKDWRRKGLGTALIKEAESIARKNQCTFSKMLIGIQNTKSLNLASKLGYTKKDRWNFYNLLPKKNFLNDVIFTDNSEQLFNLIRSFCTDYVKSWRWLPITSKSLESLTKQNQVIITKEKNQIDSIAIISESDYGSNLIITLPFFSDTGIKKLLPFIQDLGFKKNCKSIQILTKAKSLNYNHLEKRFSFFLIEKKL